MTVDVRATVLCAVDDAWRSANEIADLTGISPSYVRTKLSALFREGTIVRRKIGNGFFWKLPVK